MGWSEKDICIKCDKGGKVLSCCDSSCPIAVHENCLGFPAKFDNLGNFCCPYCSYRQATEKLHQARENALLRKKALSNFIDMEMINGGKHMSEVGKSEEGSGKLQNTGKGNDNLGSDKDNKLDEATIQKSPVQSDEEQEMDEFAPESTRSISLHEETDVALLCKENNVLPSKYGDSARTCQCNDRLVVIGHQTISGPIVACGPSDVFLEEEGTVQNFQMVEISRQILLEKHKQFTDKQPAKPADNDIEDGHFSDFPLGEKQGRENYFSHSAKCVDNDANPTGEGDGKIEGEEVIEEQVPQSISSFAIDPAMPVALEEKGEAECTDTSYREVDPTSASKRLKRNDQGSHHLTDVNCLRRSCHISSSARRANVENIGERNAPAGLKQVTEPSPGLCNVAQSIEFNANTELKQVSEHSPRFSWNFFPNTRRKKLPWQDEEEEILREGVQKYSAAEDKNIPWRKILEFGRHVFHDTRTPVDLKDKWRNVLAKET